jgi:hypothetical protein
MRADDQILEIKDTKEGVYYIIVTGEGGAYGILVGLDNRPIIVQSPKLPRYSMFSFPFTGHAGIPLPLVMCIIPTTPKNSPI